MKWRIRRCVTCLYTLRKPPLFDRRAAPAPRTRTPRAVGWKLVTSTSRSRGPRVRRRPRGDPPANQRSHSSLVPRLGPGAGRSQLHGSSFPLSQRRKRSQRATVAVRTAGARDPPAAFAGEKSTIEAFPTPIAHRAAGGSVTSKFCRLRPQALRLAARDRRRARVTASPSSRQHVVDVHFIKIRALVWNSSWTLRAPRGDTSATRACVVERCRHHAPVRSTATKQGLFETSVLAARTFQARSGSRMGGTGTNNAPRGSFRGSRADDRLAKQIPPARHYVPPRLQLWQFAGCLARYCGECAVSVWPRSGRDDGPARNARHHRVMATISLGRTRCLAKPLRLFCGFSKGPRVSARRLFACSFSVSPCRCAGFEGRFPCAGHLGCSSTLQRSHLFRGTSSSWGLIGLESHRSQ